MINMYIFVSCLITFGLPKMLRPWQVVSEVHYHHTVGTALHHTTLKNLEQPRLSILIHVHSHTVYNYFANQKHQKKFGMVLHSLASYHPPPDTLNVTMIFSVYNTVQRGSLIGIQSVHPTSLTLGLDFFQVQASKLHINESLNYTQWLESRYTNWRVTGLGQGLRLGRGLRGAVISCLLYTSPSPRDATLSRMPSSA